MQLKEIEDKILEVLSSSEVCWVMIATSWFGVQTFFRGEGSEKDSRDYCKELSTALESLEYQMQLDLNQSSSWW